LTSERRQYVGGAVSTTLSTGINASDTSIVIGSASGWPDGSVGPFFIVIDRGNAGEEKIKCSARVGTTLTATTRGADNTTAASHSSGVTVEHCLAADDLNVVNLHATDGSGDDHAQYLNTTRHDVTARHTFGAGLGTPGAATTSAVGDAAAAGSAATPARSDHVHGRESFATPAIVLGSAAAAGSASTPIRSNATIAAFDATAPTTSAVGDAAAVGTAAFAAHRDHVHGREGFGAVTAVAQGDASANGSATTLAHSDHNHGWPSAAPRGVIARASITADQTGFTTVADVTGLTVTFTAVASRRYRYTVTGHATSNTTDDVYQVQITDSGGTQKRAIVDQVRVATNPQYFQLTWTEVPGAGSTTRKVRFGRAGGSVGTWTFTAGSTTEAELVVEDIGT